MKRRCLTALWWALPAAAGWQPLFNGRDFSGWEQVGKAVWTIEAGAIVIGLPLNLDGSEGPRAQSTRAFARNLAARIAVPIVFWDERLSTAAVERHLIEAGASRKRRAQVIDRMAAAYILQGALDRLKCLSEPG